MFRFDRLIHQNMLVCDVKQRFPQTTRVFEEFGFRSPCDDCDIGTVARKNGHSSLDVIDALNRAVFGKGIAEEETDRL